MLAFKLAFKNLIGAGLRTWLNVIVLSFSYVVIIWHYGLLDGWHVQAKRDMINWEIGGGVYWHKSYDPYDIFTLEDSHSQIPNKLVNEVQKGLIEPVLIAQASIYPEGRVQSILLKGIDPQQGILELPTAKLDTDITEIPAIIGTRMAKSSKLKGGDYVTVRWRDKNGTFDAADIKITGIFKTNVPAIDNGQLWIPLQRLQNMIQLEGHATIMITSAEHPVIKNTDQFVFKDHKFLLSEIEAVIEQKKYGGSIMYIILMFLALLAIFDTQVLSIFRRQKEIGMHIAMGMTRGQVVRLFTIEGAMHGILAAVVAAIYGIPLLSIQAVHGLKMPEMTDDYGMAAAETIFPVYSLGLILTTVIIVMVTATIVSYMPARKIAKMKPTDAIKGKIQ